MKMLKKRFHQTCVQNFLIFFVTFKKKCFICLAHQNEAKWFNLNHKRVWITWQFFFWPVQFVGSPLPESWDFGTPYDNFSRKKIFYLLKYAENVENWGLGEYHFWGELFSLNVPNQSLLKFEKKLRRLGTMLEEKVCNWVSFKLHSWFIEVIHHNKYQAKFGKDFECNCFEKICFGREYTGQKNNCQK